MKAIILAAGVGRRMMPLTRDTASRSCRSRAGRCWLLDSRRGPIRRHSRSGKRRRLPCRRILREFVAREFPDLLITWVENPRYRETNNICSWRAGLGPHPRRRRKERIESDLVISPQVPSAAAGKSAAQCARCWAPHVGRAWTARSSAAIRKAALVTDVFPPHLQPGNFDYLDKLKTLNIYKFSRQFCDETLTKLMQFYARAFDENCYYEVILGVLIYLQRAEIYAEVIDPEHPADTTWRKWTIRVDPRRGQLPHGPPRPASDSRKRAGRFLEVPASRFPLPSQRSFPHARHDRRLALQFAGPAPELRFQPARAGSQARAIDGLRRPRNGRLERLFPGVSLAGRAPARPADARAAPDIRRIRADCGSDSLRGRRPPGFLRAGRAGSPHTTGRGRHRESEQSDGHDLCQRGDSPPRPGVSKAPSSSWTSRSSSSARSRHCWNWRASRGLPICWC